MDARGDQISPPECCTDTGLVATNHLIVVVGWRRLLRTIKPGTVINDISAHEDMMTTLLAAAGEPNVKDELLKGKRIGDRTYKVHLDGYDLVPALKGDGEWPRKEFIYWTDDGNVAALRYENWKVTFLEQKAEGLRVWQEPFDELRAA